MKQSITSRMILATIKYLYSSKRSSWANAAANIMVHVFNSTLAVKIFIRRIGNFLTSFWKLIFVIVLLIPFFYFGPLNTTNWVLELFDQSWQKIGSMEGPQAAFVGSLTTFIGAILAVLSAHALSRSRSREEWKRREAFALVDAAEDSLLGYEEQFDNLLMLSVLGDSFDKNNNLSNLTNTHKTFNYHQKKLIVSLSRLSRCYSDSSLMDSYVKLIKTDINNIGTCFLLGLDIENISESTVDISINEESARRALQNLSKSFMLMSHAIKYDVVEELREQQEESGGIAKFALAGSLAGQQADLVQSVDVFNELPNIALGFSDDADDDDEYSFTNFLRARLKAIEHRNKEIEIEVDTKKSMPWANNH